MCGVKRISICATLAQHANGKLRAIPVGRWDGKKERRGHGSGGVSWQGSTEQQQQQQQQQKPKSTTTTLKWSKKRVPDAHCWPGVVARIRFEGPKSCTRHCCSQLCGMLGLRVCMNNASGFSIGFSVTLRTHPLPECSWGFAPPSLPFS